MAQIRGNKKKIKKRDTNYGNLSALPWVLNQFYNRILEIELDLGFVIQSPIIKFCFCRILHNQPPSFRLVEEQKH